MGTISIQNQSKAAQNVRSSFQSSPAPKQELFQESKIGKIEFLVQTRSGCFKTPS